MADVICGLDAQSKARELLTEPDGTLHVTGTATPVTPVVSTALEASHVLKGSGGTHVSTQVQIDASAPSGTYYVQFLQGSATVPADGAVTHLHSPQRVDHVTGTGDVIVFDDSAAPATFTTGLSVVLSTTRFTKTISGAYLAIDGSVR